jgi:hypothetical protein
MGFSRFRRPSSHQHCSSVSYRYCSPLVYLLIGSLSSSYALVSSVLLISLIPVLYGMLVCEDEIHTLEEVLTDEYNQVALCDQEGTAILADKVNIDTDTVDAFGDDVDTGNDSSLPFTWLVEFEGECRGCISGTSLFGPGESGSAPGDGTCSCDLPTVEAYVQHRRDPFCFNCVL